MNCFVADESSKVVTQAAAQPGRCLSLNGVDQYVTAPIGVSMTYPFTLMAWVRATTVEVGTLRTPISLASTTDSNKYIGITLRETSGVYRANRRNGVTDYATESTFGYVVGAWEHVGLVLHSSTDFSLFVNGVPQSFTSTAVAIDAGFDQIVLGAIRSVGPAWQYNGRVFDARLYNREITAAEFANIFNTARPGGRPQDSLYAANLVGHWKLDDHRTKTNPASLMYDSSGNSYHGGIVNVSTGASYQGSDVPFSWQSESGYSSLDNVSLPASWVTVDDVADWTSWTATGAGSTALSAQSYQGETGLYAARFASGAVGGYANNRVASTPGTASLLAGELHIGEIEIAFSRPLVSGESIRCYFVGSITGPLIDILPGEEPIAQFKKYLGRTQTNDVVWSGWFVVHPSTDVTGGELTVYIKHAKLIQTNISEPANGPLDGKVATETNIPQNSTTPTQDIFGNALTYVGPLARQASLLDSNCGTFDGVDDFAVCTGDPFNFDRTDAFSFTARVKTALNGVQQSMIGTLTNAGYSFELANNGAVRFVLAANTGINDFMAVQTDAVINDGEWHSVAATYDGSGSNAGVTFYIDGVETAKSATGNLDSLSSSSQQVGIDLHLCRRPGGLFEFDGGVMDLQVFNSALSAADILAIANCEDIVPQPVGHWPFSEGDGDIAHDVSGNGNHATISGHSRATFWGTKQSVYHRNIKKGHRIANATGTSRTFDGTQYFTLADNADVSVAGHVNAWFVAYVKIGLASTLQYVFSKYNSAANKRDWALYLTAQNAAGFIGTSDGTSNLFNQITPISQFALNDYALIFAYHDADNDQVAIAVDDAVFSSNSYTHGIADTDASVTVSGRNEGAAELFTGEVLLAAMGKPTGTPDWTAIRDAIYNGGTPLTFEQLTAEQKTDWGVTLWCDCDEYEPFLRDKMNDYKLTGVNMPRIPMLNNGTTGADGNAATNPAGAWHNGAETKLDFTGGVNAPFKDQMYLGYAGLGGTMAGPLVTQGIEGKVADKLSVYCKFRNVDPTGGNLAIFSADNGAGGSFATLLLRTGWDVSLFDGTHKAVNVGGAAAIDDGEWHDLLLVWHGTQGLVYLDSVLIDEVVMVDLATYAPNWTRARILSNANGTDNRYIGDIARIVVQAQASVPSTQFANTPLLDVRFDHGRIADQRGNMPVVVSGSGLSFVKTTVPTAYEYRGSLPTGMTRSRTGYRESRYSLYNTDI